MFNVSSNATFGKQAIFDGCPDFWPSFSATFADDVGGICNNLSMPPGSQLVFVPADNSQVVDPPVLINSGARLTKNGSGSTVFLGNFTLQGQAIVEGNGAVYFEGVVSAFRHSECSGKMGATE